MGALPFAIQLLTALPGLIKAGIDVTQLLKTQTASLNAMQSENRAPTAEEWSSLNASLKPLEDSIDAAHKDGL